MNHLRRVNPGDPITADGYNALVDAITAGRVAVDASMEAFAGPFGTLLRANPPERIVAYRCLFAHSTTADGMGAVGDTTVGFNVGHSLGIGGVDTGGSANWEIITPGIYRASFSISLRGGSGWSGTTVTDTAVAEFYVNGAVPSYTLSRVYAECDLLGLADGSRPEVTIAAAGLLRLDEEDEVTLNLGGAGGSDLYLVYSRTALLEYIGPAE